MEMPMQTEDVQVPPEENFDSPAMQGSMQQILSENLGLYAICEFVVGTQDLTRKEGILYSVGRNFVVLFDENDQNFVVCDIFSIKFVTLFMPGHRPWRISRTPPVPMVEVPGVGTVPAGEYGLGTGNAPIMNRNGRSTGGTFSGGR